MQWLKDEAKAIDAATRRDLSVHLATATPVMRGRSSANLAIRLRDVVIHEDIAAQCEIPGG